MNMGLILLIVAFVVLLLASVPVGVILLVCSLVPSFYDPSFSVDALYTVRNWVSTLDSTVYISIPMFILSGVLMAKGGIAQKIYDVFAYFAGKLPGGLPSCVVLTCLFYGAISGSGAATTAAVGAMTIPVLVELGYDKVFCAALIAISGGLGSIIPPSNNFILYATASSGKVSVGEMFQAGIVPGILIGVFLIGYTVIYCVRRGEDREKIKARVDVLRVGGFGHLLKESIWALLSPVIVLGSIYSGIMTPTEASVASVVYALIVSLFVYKTIKIKELWKIFRESVVTNSSIMIIIIAASIFAKVVILERVPALIEGMMGGEGANVIIVLLIINGILIIVGALMDAGSALLIFTPILLPICTSLGVNPVHLGIILCVNLCIGFVTPPVGMNLYVAASMTGIKAGAIAKKCIPMMLVMGAALLLITYIPWFSTCLL